MNRNPSFELCEKDDEEYDRPKNKPYILGKETPDTRSNNTFHTGSMLTS